MLRCRRPRSQALADRRIRRPGAGDVPGRFARRVASGGAFGDLLVRDGDYFGPVVNGAARATKLARPGTVLATASVRDAVPAAAGLRFVTVPSRRLKGFDNPVTLFAVELGAALRHGA